MCASTMLDNGCEKSVTHFNETGITRIEYLKDNKLHSSNDEPAVVIKNSKGIVICEKWYKNGKLHRHNGLPAVRMYYGNSLVSVQKCYVNGVLHSNYYIPTVVKYDIEGDVLMQEWYRNGVLHRIGKPSRIVYNHLKEVTCEYYFNGVLHRDNDLPAVTIRRKYSTNRDVWYHYGQKMRLTSDPCDVTYDTCGTILHQTWNINGEEITDKDTALKRIKHVYTDALLNTVCNSAYGDSNVASIIVDMLNA